MNDPKPLGRGLSSLIPRKPNPQPVAPAPVVDPVVPVAPPVPAMRIVESVVPAVASIPTKIFGATLAKQKIFDIPVSLIDANPHQPRHRIEDGPLDELVDSIRQHGIINPIIVTADGSRYQIVAGERRFRAAERLGLASVPAIVRETRELERLELAIIENVQRENLNPVEEAQAYQQLADEFGLTQEEIAKKVGKSRTTVANALRILSLPPDMQQALRDGRITTSHAKILLTAVTPAERQELFAQILNQRLPVRAAAQLGRSTTVRRYTRRKVDPEIQAAEDDLRSRFGTKVTITKRDHRGTVAIEFYSDEEYQQLIQRLH